MSRPNHCPNCGAALEGRYAAVAILDDRSGDGGWDASCRTCEWSGDVFPDDEQVGLRAEDSAVAAGGRGSGGGDWLSRVPEPWLSVLKTEAVSRSRKARRILDAAAGDEEKLREARERIVKMGLDPDGVSSAEDPGT